MLAMGNVMRQVTLARPPVADARARPDATNKALGYQKDYFVKRSTSATCSANSLRVASIGAGVVMSTPQIFKSSIG